MRDQRRQMRPVDLRARLDMALEIVGVQLDQPGQDEIARAIDLAAGHVIALGNRGDDTRLDGQRTGATRSGSTSRALARQSDSCDAPPAPACGRAI